jgi:FtsP/CotA-like multicopper oxidase with cupredoxin domain
MTITDSYGYDITNIAKINRYSNAQSPGNLWYHDHSMGLTNYNIIAGIAGYYILRDHKTEK